MHRRNDVSPHRSTIDWMIEVVREESGALQPMVLLGNGIARLLPDNTLGRARWAILRSAGWRIDRTVYLAGVPTWAGSGPIRERLTIGRGCFINVRCHFELNDVIQIEPWVSIGHDVLVLTSTHRIGSTDRRAGDLTTAPVVIEEGAWIGARSVILPGITVGHGSIVGAGAVVTKDVPPNTLVTGTPARVRRQLSE